MALGFAAAIAAVLGGGLISAEALSVRRANVLLVTRTLATMNALQRLENFLDEGESGQRGYLLTGEERYLQPYEEALASTGEALARLREEMVDDPRRLERLASLEMLVRRKLAEMEHTLRVYRDQGNAAALAVVKTDEGMRLMERIEVRIGEMQDEEAALLDERQATWSRAVTATNVVFVVADVLLLGLILLAAVLVRREFLAREEREAERARTVELQQHLMGIVGHDLRTPLAAIVISADLLARTAELPEARRATARRILSSARRMEGMIRDLLDFTRVRLGVGIPLSPRRADIAEVCRKVIDEIVGEHHDRALESRIEGDVTGEWDPGRLEQVVANLVGNAIGHSPEGTPVSVYAGGGDEGVVIEVHNEGPPIPDELRQHLFEPFRRGRAAGDRGGIGLGLFIVRSIVEAHGGTVEARSAEGEGVTFRVRLPRRAPAPHAPAA